MKPKSSKFIELDPNKCIACWKCIDICTNQALGRVAFLWHKHVVLRKPDNCSGCCRCVKICQHGAISKISGVSNT